MSNHTANEDPQLVDAEAVAQLIKDGALLIDVRSERGRASTGSVPGALVVDREKIAQDFGPEPTDRRPEVTGPEQKIVVFCGSVNGSRPVAEKLKVLGYSDAVHVDGGFLALRDAGVATTAPTVNTAAAQTSTDSAVSAR